MGAYPIVRLKKGREKKIRGRYPWVQKEEVVSADSAAPGTLAHLYDHEGKFLAVGTWNPLSRFPFRVLSLEDEPIDRAFFLSRFVKSASRRREIAGTDAHRMVFSEADELPGLIVDCYRDKAVAQVRSAAMEAMKPVWLPALVDAFQVTGVYERSEMEGRREEGLQPVAGLLYGEVPEAVPFTEDGLEFQALVVNGLKTGFYLDQRDARRRLAARVKPGDRVLDCFCYSGGFSLHAARAGAECRGVDITPAAIAAAQSHAQANGLDIDFVEANAFEYLQQPAATQYGWIILDPPAIAKSREKRDSLKWGVWNLVHRGIDHLAPGGRMVVCSCSYQLNLADLLDTVRLAANDKGKVALLEEVTVQALDHPISLSFPESWYLKCAWVRIE